MIIAAVFTGNELLTGSTINTNLTELGRLLTSHNIQIDESAICRDNQSSLCRTIGNALDRADTLIICGGLGATTVYITLDAVSRFFGIPLIEESRLAEKVKNAWSKRHKGHMPKSQLRQARVFQNARIFDNAYGTAPGIALDTLFDGRERRIYILPGPPHEFMGIMREHVIGELVKRAGNEQIFTSGFLACATGEAEVSRVVKNAGIDSELNCAYTASPEGCRFYLSGKEKQMVLEALEKIRQALGPMAFEIGELSLEEKIINIMKKSGMTLATAESCTGGLTGAVLTSVPGASEVYTGGAVTYSNEMKMQLLGVKAETLQKHGAVSPETAAEMASGACRRFSVDAAIAVTGIAGPAGGTLEKPVGLVYVGVCVREQLKVIELRLTGDRDTIRRKSCASALSELYKIISGIC